MFVLHVISKLIMLLHALSFNQLRRPVMKKTAAYGHFGRSDPDFLWEVPKELVI